MIEKWHPQSRGNLTVHTVSANQFNHSLAANIAQRLKAAISARGFAVLSVSGGKSPIALFEALRVIDIEWSRVRITLVDERYVPNNHADSNAQLVQTHLLKDLAEPATLVLMVSATFEPLPVLALQATLASNALLAAGTADVLILGMGVDGHTASLFPNEPNLAQALNTNSDKHNAQACVGIELVKPPSNAPYPRITQTLAQILSARHIVLSIMGTDKMQTLKRAWANANSALPISFVLQQTQTPVALWLSGSV
jgi:6-phosphogluconolactonase